eukprot:6700_1
MCADKPQFYHGEKIEVRLEGGGSNSMINVDLGIVTSLHEIQCAFEDATGLTRQHQAVILGCRRLKNSYEDTWEETSIILLKLKTATEDTSVTFHKREQFWRTGVGKLFLPFVAKAAKSRTQLIMCPDAMEFLCRLLHYVDRSCGVFDEQNAGLCADKLLDKHRFGQLSVDLAREGRKAERDKNMVFVIPTEKREISASYFASGALAYLTRRVLDDAEKRARNFNEEGVARVLAPGETIRVRESHITAVIDANLDICMGILGNFQSTKLSTLPEITSESMKISVTRKVSRVEKPPAPTIGHVVSRMKYNCVLLHWTPPRKLSSTDMDICFDLEVDIDFAGFKSVDLSFRDLQIGDQKVYFKFTESHGLKPGSIHLFRVRQLASAPAKKRRGRARARAPPGRGEEVKIPSDWGTSGTVRVPRKPVGLSPKPKKKSDVSRKGQPKKRGPKPKAKKTSVKIEPDSSSDDSDFMESEESSEGIESDDSDSSYSDGIGGPSYDHTSAAPKLELPNQSVPNRSKSNLNQLVSVGENSVSRDLVSRNPVLGNVVSQNPVSRNLVARGPFSQNPVSRNPQVSQNPVPRNLGSRNQVPLYPASQNSVSRNLGSRNLISPRNKASQNLGSRNLILPRNQASQNPVSQKLGSQNLGSRNLMAPRNQVSQNPVSQFFSQRLSGGQRAASIESQRLSEAQRLVSIQRIRNLANRPRSTGKASASRKDSHSNQPPSRGSKPSAPTVNEPSRPVPQSAISKKTSASKNNLPPGWFLDSSSNSANTSGNRSPPVMNPSKNQSAVNRSSQLQTLASVGNKRSQNPSSSKSSEEKSDKRPRLEQPESPSSIPSESQSLPNREPVRSRSPPKQTLICMFCACNPPDFVYIPCGHHLVCGTCVDKRRKYLQNCSLCARKIDQIARLELTENLVEALSVEDVPCKVQNCARVAVPIMVLPCRHLVTLWCLCCAKRFPICIACPEAKHIEQWVHIISSWE